MEEKDIESAIRLAGRCFTALCWGGWAVLTMMWFMDLVDITFKQTLYPLAVFFTAIFVIGALSWVTNDGSK